MVKIGKDLVVIGGYSSLSGHSSSVFKLSCSFGNCQWTKMRQELKIPRREMVAIAVPNEFLNCGTSTKSRIEL